MPKTIRKMTIFTNLGKIIISIVRSPTGTISFQVSKQVKPGDDISLTVNLIKDFLSKIGEVYFTKEVKNSIQFSQVTRSCDK